MKRILIIVSLVLISIASGFAQSGYDFTRSDTVQLNGVSKWKNIGGMDTTASLGVLSNQGYPYNVLGNTFYGGVYWDSALAVGSTGYQVRFVLKQLSGTDNIKNFYFVIADSNTFNSYGGYGIYIQEMASAAGDYMYLREPRNGNTIENGGGGTTYPDGISAPMQNGNHAANDTFYISVYPNGRKTAARKRGSSIDSLTTLDSTFNVTSGAWVWLYGRNSTTQFLVDDFRITALSAPVAGVDTIPPDVTSFSASSSSVVTNQAFTLSGTISDLYGISYSVIDSSQNGSTWSVWDSVKVNNGTAQTSYIHTSPSFSRATVDTVYFRLRAREDSSHAGYTHFDTSNTVTVKITSAPIVSQYSRKVYGHLTFDDTRWAGSSTGVVPADSLPWSILTHVGLFAASGANPAQSSYINQLAPMATRAHQSGVYAGLVVGGSGDVALVTLMNTPAAWTAWINTYLSYIDTYGIDFLDFDLEGSYTAANVGTFLTRLNDSLAVRVSDNNPSVPPFIVLTVGMARSELWGATTTITNSVAFVNIMSYDFIGGGVWGRLIHDCSMKSYANYDGTGTNTDFYAPAGSVNGPAPSLQRAAKRANGGGWPLNKILVGFDVNPTYYFSTATTGRGPLYIRQPESEVSGYADASSNPDFATTWPTMNAWPTDSVHFDTVAQTYWIHVGTGPTTDRVYTFTTMPGRDSGVIAARKVVDSMNLGGLMIWNLGSEVWNTASVPPGGRGWFFSQLKDRLASLDTIPAALNPPTTFSPVSGATGVSLTATYDWNDVAGATAYHIQVGTSASFSSGTINLEDGALAVSQKVLTALTNGTVYYARVRVKNAANVWGGWSTVQTFTTIPAAPNVPVLGSPVDGATAQPQTITFLWTIIVSGATPTHYQLLVDDDVGFSSPLVSDSTITTLSRQVAGLTNAATYYWKIRAKSYPGVWSAYATARSFTVGAAIPTIPTLLSPGNGASNQSTTPTFTWTRPAGADSFQLQIDSTIDFATPLKDTLTANSSYVTTLVSGLTYYWRVYSNGTAGNSAYSSPYQLTIGTDVQPPAPGSPYRTNITYDPVLGKYTSSPQTGVEMIKVPLYDLQRPYDTNTVMMGVLGYKEFDGDTFRTGGSVSSGGGSLTASAIQDSLGTLRLDSLELSDPYIYNQISFKNTGDTTNGTNILPSHGNRAITVILPSQPGTIGLKDNVSESYSIGSMQLASPLSTAYGGTNANLSATSGAGYALFKESDTVRARAITTSDIVGYSTAGAPTGSKIIDSLNTNTTLDTLTKSITMKDDSLRFITNTTIRGYLNSHDGSSGNGGIILAGTGNGNYGVVISDAGTGNFTEVSLAKNGLYYKVTGSNDVYEIQNRASSTVRNDSLFQITDSGAAGSGKPTFQVSNFGDLGLYDRTAGSDAFTTTAAADTVTITGASSADYYYITLTGTAAPSANDLFRVEATSTGFIIRRSASGTSGLTYNWLRIKNI